MIPLPDLLLVAAYVAGAAVVVAGGGLLCLRLFRGSSVTVLLAIVAGITVVATLAGVVVTAQAMFISPHDRAVVLTLVVIAGAAGFTVAFLLGRSVVADTGRLRRSVRAVGDGGTFVPPAGPLPAELAEVAAELSSAHERLAGLRARERALEDSRRELVAWVSHDLRTPLAGVRAMAEALEDGVVSDPETMATYYERMRLEADRLATMVDDLFELARIHAGALRLSRQRITLDDLVAEAVASADPLAQAKGVRLRGSTQPGLPVEVDAGELGRALRNLLVNAIRHTPGDGAVEVAGAADGSVAYVTVLDACGGIPEEDVSRVFDTAFRGETARTPGPDGGAGLGLAIARGIVEAHAGEIGVANAGVGCRFEVRLPLSDRQLG